MLLGEIILDSSLIMESMMIMVDKKGISETEQID
jgi:hypothetical protein